MGRSSLALVDAPEALRAALPPLRRRLLDRLREPASAVVVAGEFGLPRQQVNYHQRTLEAAGFLELVETRARRLERPQVVVDLLARQPEFPGHHDRGRRLAQPIQQSSAQRRQRRPEGLGGVDERE